MGPVSRDWPAPAKINRFLHITGRRADGYHELQTLFQFVEPVDGLVFAMTPDGTIRREGGLPGLPPESDLAVRAATVLRHQTGSGPGVRIQLDKRIPAGGGLGGGSSDAATTLVALNELWGCGLSTAELEQIGLGLGADVPVFVRGLACWAEGVGERLSPLSVDCPWMVIIDPGVSVDTRSVFTDTKLTRHGERITIRGFETGAARNDCEPVVRRIHPAVGEALDALAAFGPSRLTGTGGCLFATFQHRASAEHAAAGVRDRWSAWVTRAMNRSPLLDRLDAERARTTGA
ncbi:4-(cytidine 5'-diphospho)-2-C-methyl-D-erythritol kinase [Spiribacter onubensis]|uniref:4-diphosphocytidyl-2-C-methyl-D-erythritol kinase n=1 Tax=Spiribacter onubensis TaxID=3122420 RepID=A0ABV3S7K5_9GAMM